MRTNTKNYSGKDSRNYSQVREYDAMNGQIAAGGVANLAIGGILVGCSYTNGLTDVGKTVLRVAGYGGVGVGTAGIGLGIAGATLDHYLDGEKEKKDSACRNETPCGKKQDKVDIYTLIK